MANWFVIKGDKKHGPFSSAQLKKLASEGKLKPVDQVRREDQQTTCEAQKIKGLFESTSPPPLPSPATLVISRRPKLTGFSHPVKVSLDGTSMGIIGGGFADGLIDLFQSRQHSLTLEVQPGEHVLELYGGGLGNRKTITFAGGQAYRFIAAFSNFGALGGGLQLHEQGEEKQAFRFGRIAILFGGVGAVFFGACFLAILIDVLKSDSLDSKRSASQTATIRTGVEAKGDENIPPTQPQQLEEISLANGRMPIRKFIDFLKREEKLDVSTSDGGIEAKGTPLVFVEDIVGEPCRIYIGGREDYGQNVAAVFVASENDQQIAAVVAETPLDLLAGRSRGNDVTSIFAFVKRMLPESDMRKLVKEQSTKLALGNSITADYGKASVSLSYDQPKRRMRVVVFVAR